MKPKFIKKVSSFLGWSALFSTPVLAAPSVFFSDFTYKGMDLSVGESQVDSRMYRNPILKGYYPDPSICRVGDDYYLVNSSFTHFPSIPVWHSTDLVNWDQVAFAVDKPENANFNGLSTSKGMFAPAISYHDGLFYVICTNVGGYGNFYVTAEDPSGPWSDPILLPFINGIDPSFFFDDDGSAYIVHNGEAPDNAPQYNGHRAIWLWKYDLESNQAIEGPMLLVDGGVDISKNPIWIEGPHIFKKDDLYYLICAEGGTAWDHSEVVFRANSLSEPFVPYSQNPILTQRDQDRFRLDPISCVGHADFVETPEGDWWSVFLGCRTYEGYHTHMGRETFLLPITWTEDDWPVILPQGELIPELTKAPYPKSGSYSVATDFSDSFESETICRDWTFLRTPMQKWYSLDYRKGYLSVDPLPQGLDSNHNPSFIGYRQKDKHFYSSVTLGLPQKYGISGGMAVYQSEMANLYCGVYLNKAGEYYLFIEKNLKGDVERVLEYPLDGIDTDEITISLSVDNSVHVFGYSLDAKSFTSLPHEIYGQFLSTQSAGGFVGVVMGPYARKEK